MSIDFQKDLKDLQHTTAVTVRFNCCEWFVTHHIASYYANLYTIKSDATLSDYLSLSYKSNLVI